MIKKYFIIILILFLICPSDAFAKRKKKRARAYLPTAVSALVVDATHNRYFYAKQIDRRIFPASTTKIMTALLVLERLKLDQYVTVSAKATQAQPTKLDLRVGEQYKVRDLMYGLLLKSANDAAEVLAEAVAGSHAQFVEMMNARARQLGATNTRFANAHGLPSDTKQYSTARDMATIFKEALKKPFLRQALTFKYRILYSKDGRRHFVKSHNKSLFLDWRRDVYGKTGYTRQAQSCFVGHVLKGKDTYIVAVFGCRKRWEDIKFIVEKYGKIDL